MKNDVCVPHCRKTLQQWLDYIETIHVSAIDLGLQRISAVAAANQLTHFDCPVVTVAGTNGKGSVVRTLESIYLAAGYRVAAYTSPHLLDFTERLQINGKPCSEQAFVQAFEHIEKIRNNQPLSLFEYYTLAALWICRQNDLDMILLEIGLGGRLDAVNVVEPDIAVITSIGIDHVSWLGATREEIGFEKAGIFREGKPAICGDPNPPQSVLDVAAEKGAELCCFGRDYTVSQQGGRWQWCGPNKSYLNLPLPQLKLQNVATAMMVTEQVPLALTQYALIKGIATACLSGRYEVIQRHCKVILDVAHNEDSAQALLNRFQHEPVAGKKFAVVAMLQDKDIRATLAPFDHFFDRWCVANLTESDRGATSERLAQHLADLGRSAERYSSVIDAFAAVFSTSCAEDAILVFGSFHTVASVKRYLMESV